MHRTDTPERSYLHRRPDTDDPRFLILVFMATVTVTLAALALAVPQPIVLPAFSLCALAAAAGVALTASMRTRLGGRSSVSAWNLVGAFTLVGCAAAIFGEPEVIVEYTRQTPPRSTADD
jgi:hypothetical protein